MRRDSANNPELFVPPPFFYANCAPSQLQHARADNADEEQQKPDARQIAQRWDDELPGEQTDRRKSAVSDKRERSERIDNGVDVGESFQPPETAGGEAVPERAVSAEENFD
eukprot:TRINITY_DN3286_c0_g2_i1.p4 TRINITY_DN3286_c0_g2~~TRINITY_DN3286_c0_g2_i1.p4  ORF type:complete len:111 (-),score=20.45 TRINITY_DN3286_c0_g2_i1:1393-1725(-)